MFLFSFLKRFELVERLFNILPQTCFAQARSPETLEDKIRRLRAFISQTFDLTVCELRASGTFSRLQMANDAMLGSVRDERWAFEERAVNRNALEVLRDKKKRHRQQHKVTRRPFKKWGEEKKGPHRIYRIKPFSFSSYSISFFFEICISKILP